ncbi:MAG: alpha/beta hydrolase [Acutalibacteraceae bacterium]
MMFKKGGWKGFEEYSYSNLLKSDSLWIEQKGEQVETENAEGITLKGIRIENEHISHSYVIMCHQYGGSPETMTEYAKHFYDLGFNIVLPYLRGSEESEYGNISLGWGDSDDIASWVDSIIENDKDARIALFGVSMGANAVTLAASKELPENVRLVISDSCYTSVADLMKEYVKNDTPFSPLIVTGLTSAFSKAKVGEGFKKADTVAGVKDIELPIMFINGENDVVVPSIVSKKLYENCEADGVEEVIISEGTHGRNVEADATDYWSSIDSFILNNLGI